MQRDYKTNLNDYTIWIQKTTMVRYTQIYNPQNVSEVHVNKLTPTLSRPKRGDNNLFKILMFGYK